MIDREEIAKEIKGAVRVTIYEYIERKINFIEDTVMGLLIGSIYMGIILALIYSAV